MVGVRQFDEQEMIAIALDVFWRKGLHDATMQDLAAATGVQRGSLYNAYGDKEAIFLRAFDQYAGQLMETAAMRWPRATTAARLQNFLICMIVNMTSGSPPRGCLTTRTALDGAISSAAVASACKACSAGSSSSSARRSVPLPISGSQIDPNRLARVVVTFTRGLAVMERAGYSRKQLKESAVTFVDALVGDA